RIALDSVVCALSVGEGCVEGVRRLATPSAGVLLRAERAPSATWTRRVLGRFADSLGAVCLHLGMSQEYIEAARIKAGERPVVFYVGNVHAAVHRRAGGPTRLAHAGQARAPRHHRLLRP